MKLLFISSEYPPDTGFGGIATYTKHAAEGMAARGHSVTVICRSIDIKDKVLLENGVSVRRLVAGPYPLPLSPVFYPLRRLCYSAIPASLIRLAWAKTVSLACSRLVKEEGAFDVIEYPECGAEGFYISGLRWVRSCVTVARLHTPWEFIHRFDRIREPLPDLVLQSYLERTSTRRATAVSAPSHAIARLVSKSWRLKQVSVYPNPLPATVVPTKGKEWLYLGRIERRKGVHLLIKAYADVCSKRSPPLLRLVGRPYGNMPCGRPYGDYIRNLIRESGMRERISWVEGVPHDSVRECIARSSAAFFPSLWENFSYACIEAMAGGCAVVASDCGGFPEMITHDRSGLLFETGNTGALSAQMHRLIDENGLAGRLGQSAVEYVRDQCDQTIVCAHAERFYQTLAEHIRKPVHHPAPDREI